MTIREEIQAEDDKEFVRGESKFELFNGRARSIKPEGDRFTVSEGGPGFYMRPISLNLSEYGSGYFDGGGP
jgi:hypothetical protein